VPDAGSRRPSRGHRAAAVVALTCALWAATAAAVATHPQGPVLMLVPPTFADPPASVQHLRKVLEASQHAGQANILVRHVPEAPPERERVIGKLLQELAPRVVWTVSMSLSRTVQLLAPDLPVVFNGAADPVAMCLVDSLIRPGRNATGYTSNLPEEAKMLEALGDAYPAVRHVIVLVDGNEGEFGPCRPGEVRARRPSPRCGDVLAVSAAQLEHLMPMRSLLDVARVRGIDLQFVELCTTADLAALKAARQRPDTALLVPVHYFFVEHAAEVVAAIRQTRAPAIYGRSLFLEHGAIVALSPRRDAEPHRRSFELVARILAGDSPASLPVQMPSGFDLHINLRAIDTPEQRPSLAALRRADHLRR
jgi:putative tryptophan/tyrosine transport system substrate-binding protein